MTREAILNEIATEASEAQMEMPLAQATAAEQRDRYERALKAMAHFAAPDSGLARADFEEWIVQTVTELLEGQEAECPICGTHVHDGPCVGDGDEDEDGDEPPSCDACGDKEGTVAS